MDANGLRFWMLADDAHWLQRAHAVWDAQCRTLQLASERTLPALDPAAALAAASAALDQVPRAVDAFDAVAYWDEAAGVIAVKSQLPDAAVVLPLADPPSDLCVGADGVLYAALTGGILMHDLRGRWNDLLVTASDPYVPWRLAPAFPGGVWALERASGRLAKLEGLPLPLPTPQPDDYAATVFRPNPENCRTPALRVQADPAWPAGERPVALASSSDAGLALLSWINDSQAAVRRWDAGAERLAPPLSLNGATCAYAIEWLDAERVAVRVPGRHDAPAFACEPITAPLARDPLGEIDPIADDGVEAPFAHSLAAPPRYPVRNDAAEPLYALSITNLARQGSATNFSGSGPGFTARILDSGSATTVWHRLYAEAAIPARTGFTVWLAATNEARPPDPSDHQSWQPHGFGRDIAALDPAFDAPQLPRAAWERVPSELPGHPGLGPWSPEPETQGLYTVLIQNSRRRVRALTGRYLWVCVVLYGDGRVGPQIAALRAYGSRFSYVDQYLPHLYREHLFGDPAQAPGELLDTVDLQQTATLDAGGPVSETLRALLGDAIPDLGNAAMVSVEQPGETWRVRDASGRSSWRLTNDGGSIGIYRPQSSREDFLGRTLANFEGVLTQLEDRIAAAHLLTDPAAAPEPQLDWVAGWIGVAFDPVLPAEHRREWLRRAEALARWHGTRRGLELALDIATGGGVRDGRIVVIEDFRLRRILATLLGVDLGDERDPLLPGLVQSGNSIVGDTLVLGDEEQVELLALFRQDVADPAENSAVLGFLGKLANRATVLVHEQVAQQDFGLIRRIVELESPAHVKVCVVTASTPLMVGVYSLVGVDTYLGPPRPRLPVQLDRSAVGTSDYLIAPVALDPRMRGVASPLASPRPVADAGTSATVGFGHSFQLDASASRAAPGRSIVKYVWRRLPPASA
jgi:phage tail-like protein